MRNSIQEQFNIVATDHDFFGDDNNLTITVETTAHKFYVQTTNGAHDSSLGCWILSDDSDGHIDWGDYAEVYGDASDEALYTIIEVADTEAERILKDKVLETIRDNDEGGEIEAKAKKIAAMIGGDVDDYLVLSNTLSNAESIAINDTMIFLQINLDCSQAQSSDIVKLFL